MGTTERKIRQYTTSLSEKEALFSLYSSYGDEISFLTLKIETFLDKERTEGLEQSHLTDFFQVVN